MRLAKVVGNVWGARQAASLQGRRLLVVRPLCVPPHLNDDELRLVADADQHHQCLGEPKVVLDALGAGPGEIVLVAHGSRCRDLTLGPEVAGKEVTLAIVDQALLQLSGRRVP